MTKNLVLLGMMGAGKSTVAMIVADRLGRPHLDTDSEVERMAGRPIPIIFEEEGEPAFRRLERLAVAHVSRHSNQVVSVGGGAVLDDACLEALRSSGVLVELRASSETLAARLATQARARPLLVGSDLPARVAELLELRAPRYALAADHSVDASGTPVEVAEAVLSWAASVPGVLSREEVGRATGRRRRRREGGQA
ncbi:MAG: shikimate kinase [Nitriliruptorales bacterium]